MAIRQTAEISIRRIIPHASSLPTTAGWQCGGAYWPQYLVYFVLRFLHPELRFARPHTGNLAVHLIVERCQRRWGKIALQIQQVHLRLLDGSADGNGEFRGGVVALKMAGDGWGVG